MKHLTDHQLIEEFNRRYRAKNEALEEYQKLYNELEKVNQKLQESEALKSHFLENIRNEINNPLTTILGHCTYLLLNEKTDEETIHKIAAMIHTEAFDLDFQLKNIFTAAELEAGEASPFISKIDLHYLIQNLVVAYMPKLLKKNIKIENKIQIQKDLFFKSDAKKIHLILSNLLNNSIKYSPDNSRIQLKSWIEDDKLHISIKDNGIGIEDSNLKSIFDRFTQIQPKTLNEHKGYGLGLCITKALLELLNGVIHISSKYEHGSTFTITIPEAKYNSEMESIVIDDNENLTEEKY